MTAQMSIDMRARYRGSRITDLAALLAVAWSGFWVGLGATMVVVSLVARDLTDDDAGAEERRLALLLVVGGVAVIAAAVWSMAVAARLSQRRAGSRGLAILTFSVWAAFSMATAVAGATGLLSDGHVVDDLVFALLNLLVCMLVVALAAQRRVREDVGAGSS